MRGSAAAATAPGCQGRSPGSKKRAPAPLPSSQGPALPPPPRPALTAAGPSLPARARAAAAFSLCRVRHRPPPGGSRRSSPGGRRRRELSVRRRDGSAIGSGVATGTAASRRGAEPGSAGSQAGAAAVTSAPRAVTPFRDGSWGVAASGVGPAGPGFRPALRPGARRGAGGDAAEWRCCPCRGPGAARGGCESEGSAERAVFRRWWLPWRCASAVSCCRGAGGRPATAGEPLRGPGPALGNGTARRERQRSLALPPRVLGIHRRLKKPCG